MGSDAHAHQFKKVDPYWMNPSEAESHSVTKGFLFNGRGQGHHRRFLNIDCALFLQLIWVVQFFVGWGIRRL